MFPSVFRLLLNLISPSFCRLSVVIMRDIFRFHYFFFFFFFFFFFIIKYLLINFLHHLHCRTLIANTNYRTVLTILTIQIVLITILTLTLLIDTITALRKEEQKRWPTYLHSLLINAKTYRPFYLFTFVIRFFFFL